MAVEDSNLPVPDLEGRAVTAEEYHAHTPEKLELIEGRLIDWDESLDRRRPFLSLLLANIGLVEAVKLAPEERWREALRRVHGR